MNYNYQSCLGNEMKEYIQYRRNGGIKFITATSVLHQFDRHLVEHNYISQILDREIVMSFLQIHENERVTNVANKAMVIRGFVKFLKNVKKMTDIFDNIPPISVKGQETFIPYIFSDEEIAKIIYNAQNYNNNNSNILPNIRNIISCAFTMLYCTGMRHGEIVNLKIQDVDISQRIIYIREAKNYNKRIVTMSNSLVAECIRYCNEAKKYKLSDIYFFDTGTDKNNGKLNEKILYRYFRELLKKSDIKHLGKGKGPRLHDIRQTFCCHSLRKLSKLDGDINSYLVYLSTFMGHKSLLETQDYIWLTADLFKETLDKMQEYTGFITDIYQKSGVTSNEESL